MSLPKWFELARAEIGVKEAPGAADNPVVQAYYRDAGHPEVKHDAVPWCAAFVGAMLKRAGIEPTEKLNARSYLDWGEKLIHPTQGCIVVFGRHGASWEGHVTFFDHWNGARLVCLGGNQSDKVCLASYLKLNVLGYRWPKVPLAEHVEK